MKKVISVTVPAYNEQDLFAGCEESSPFLIFQIYERG